MNSRKARSGGPDGGRAGRLVAPCLALVRLRPVASRPELRDVGIACVTAARTLRVDGPAIAVLDRDTERFKDARYIYPASDRALLQ